MNERIPPLELVGEGEREEDERFRLNNSVLEPQEIREIIEKSNNPLQALEGIGSADVRKRGSESADPIWIDSGNTILAGTLFLRLLLEKEGILRFKRALEEEEDLIKIRESIQDVKEKNQVGRERPTRAEVTPYLIRVTAGELYKEARELLLPEFQAFIKREIEHLR